MGTAVTGWRTQPPATQRGNDSRTLHLIFRTSPTRLSRWFVPGCSVPSCALSTQHQPKNSTMTSPPKCLKGENAIRSFYFAYLYLTKSSEQFCDRCKSAKRSQIKENQSKKKVAILLNVNFKSPAERSVLIKLLVASEINLNTP